MMGLMDIGIRPDGRWTARLNTAVLAATTSLAAGRGYVHTHDAETTPGGALTGVVSVPAHRHGKAPPHEHEAAQGRLEVLEGKVKDLAHTIEQKIGD